ncbi:TPA: hypothetical protein ACQQJD_004941 [Pseudomonas aeruginosa]
MALYAQHCVGSNASHIYKPLYDFGGDWLCIEADITKEDFS